MIFGEFLKKCTKFEAVGTAPLKQFREIFLCLAIDSPPIKVFRRKFEFLHFRFNTPFSLNQVRKSFHVLGMRAFDSPHKFTPLWFLFEKNILRSKDVKSRRNFRPNITPFWIMNNPQIVIYTNRAHLYIFILFFGCFL